MPKKKGILMAQVNCLAAKQKTVTPILGLGKTSRVDEVVEAVRVKLTNEEIAYLEEPYQPKRVTGY